MLLQGRKPPLGPERHGPQLVCTSDLSQALSTCQLVTKNNNHTTIHPLSVHMPTSDQEQQPHDDSSPLRVRPLDDEVTPTVLPVIIADGQQHVFHEGAATAKFQRRRWQNSNDGDDSSTLRVRPLEDEVTPTVLPVIIADGQQHVFHEGVRQFRWRMVIISACFSSLVRFPSKGLCREGTCRRF
jgi:hypothetical protein